MLLTSQLKDLPTYCLYQQLFKIFLLELGDNVAFCILFEIHIDLGIEYSQNADEVDFVLVLQTLESNYTYWSVIGLFVSNKAKGRISKRVIQENKVRQIFRNEHFLPPNTHVYVYVSGDKKSSLFGKFDVLCFLETPVLRFALLPYYRPSSFCLFMKWGNIGML